MQLSRKKKDKRVFGVLGMSTRNNSRPERMIINSIGEGGLWVIDSNKNIENGVSGPLSSKKLEDRKKSQKNR